ncbi:MAG: ATP-binding cassette domain-containing protein [Alphaproteobacteria bacterium]|nr:ATP-binding cassette domain-containing protein [Alphaproteobacteria bacterium]
MRKKEGFLKSLFRPEYQAVRALDGISFSLNEGERVAFVGPNGAGKSTTIKILSGILHPESGHVEIGGFVPWSERRQMAYQIGTVFGQRSQLWYHLPAKDTFELLSYAYDMDRGDYIKRAKYLIEAFDAGSIVEKPVRQLSLGERMRCEIIASLLHRPKILFLDEPTVGLDVVSKGIIRDLVKQASDEDGTTVLLTSHDTGDMERVCDRVIVIDHGRIVTDKPVRDLRSGFIKEKIVTLAMKESSIELSMGGVNIVEMSPHHLQLLVDTSQTSVEFLLQHAMQKSSLIDITVEDPPMEEIIKAIYANGAV